MGNMKEKIVIASNNELKIQEFRSAFCDQEILSLKDIGFNHDIAENGKTFYTTLL